MHIHTLDQYRHVHEFERTDRANEQKVLLVVGLTLATMLAEIMAGTFFGSMALLADGWHMGTHAVALGIAAVAYYFARSHADDPLFTFGTGKIGVLGGFTSAVILAVVALWMAVESLERLFNPQPIRFNEAILVAVLGLAVNLVCAAVLHRAPYDDHHDPDHQHHDHIHDHRDHNMRSAYLHVLADALTSVLAIFALTGGKIWRWVWMDPIMGVAGAVIISHWAYGLLRDTGKILLDRDLDRRTVDHIRRIIEGDADNRITDLHLWKVGSNKVSAIISLVTHYPRPPEHYKALLDVVPSLAHITVEVIHCDSEPCLPFQAGSK
jgi:cation diffusion facilitator family transporter